MRLSGFQVVRLVLAIALLLLFTACETKEHADAELGALKKAKDAAAKVSARAAEPIGVSECDDYISNYEACVEKSPEAERAAMRAKLDEQRKKWHDAMSAGESETTVAEQCKSAARDFTCAADSR